MSDLTRSQTMMRGNGFIRSVLTVYISLTASCFILLLCTGMQWFDALTNAMSTCSTCGFCVRNASIAFYDNAAAELIIVLFMVLSGISFVGLYTAVFKKGFRQFLHSHILRTYLLILAAGTVIMSVDLTLRGGYPTYMRALRDALFQMCSITTTTGFATADTTLWPTVSTIVIIGASLICGCAGSTSGGIKVDRIVILWKRFRINVQSFIHPRWIQAVWLDGQVVKKARIANAMSFVRIYLLIVFVGAVFNAVAGLDLMTSISAAIACTGNVGPGFGLVGSFSNYASFSDPLKYGSMIMMLAGRLEITPLLFLAIDITSNRNFHYFCRRFGKNPRT